MLKNSCFFCKTSSGFSIEIDFGTFWDFLLFLLHSTANLLNWAHFLIWKSFFHKPISVSRIPKFWTFWEVLQIQSLSMGSLLRLAVYNTFISVLDKTIFFQKITQLLKVLRSFTNLVSFPRLIATFSVFKKSSFFSEKPIFPLQKNQNTNVLRIFTIWVAFCRQICYK